MDDSERLEKFGRGFWKRFEHFRSIEAQEIAKGPFRYSNEAFVLLQDIELCYAAKAYYACIVLAHSIIETHLARVEGMTGWAAEMLKKAGIREEIAWLTKLRNDIAHGNPNQLVTIALDDETTEVLEGHCEKAFRFMHELPIRMQRLRDGNDSHIRERQ